LFSLSRPRDTPHGCSRVYATVMKLPDQETRELTCGVMKSGIPDLDGRDIWRSHRSRVLGERTQPVAEFNLASGETMSRPESVISSTRVSGDGTGMHHVAIYCRECGPAEFAYVRTDDGKYEINVDQVRAQHGDQFRALKHLPFSKACP